MAMLHNPEISTATQSAEMCPPHKIRNRRGLTFGKWQCVVEALETGTTGYNIQLVFSDLCSSAIFRTDWQEMQVDGAEVTFHLSGMPGLIGLEGHLVGRLLQIAGEGVFFTTVSADIDPVWLIGARNIALIDTNPPIEKKG